MNWFNNINISISYNPTLLIVGISLIIIYTFFIYRTTLPIVSTFWKSILIIIRITALTLILLLVFEPIVRVSSQNKIEPTNLIFIDNSISISEFNSNAQIEKLHELVGELDSKLNGKRQFFTYGSNLNTFQPIKDTLRFNETSTELNSAVNLIKQTEDIASIVIIGDGILNQSMNTDHELKNLAYPIFTIGIGDATEESDLILNRIISNEYIYANRETEIEVLLKNLNLSNSNATIELYDNDSFLLSKNIKLSRTGINRIKFPYISKEEGRRKITVRANTSKAEKNKNNNSSTSLINVLSEKKKIALLGSPSADLSFISKSIRENDEFELQQIIEIKNGSFYKNKSDLQYLKNADIIFLIGFPSSNSSYQFVKDVAQILSSSRTPIFLALSTSLDFSKLNELKSLLQLNIENNSKRFIDVQISSINSQSGLLGNSLDIEKAWQNLPPVNISISSIIPSITSEVLMTSTVNNYPMLFRNSSNNSKVIVLTAANFWRWKLKKREGDQLLFDNFILNSIKWLGFDSDNEFLSVSLDRMNYNLGESIKFIANLYDDAYEPVENELITLKIFKDNNYSEYSFQSIGNGIYEVDIELSKPGLFNYKIELGNNIRNISPKTGSINIEPINIEIVENKLNYQFLSSISNSTGGLYATVNNTNNIINELNTNYQNKIYYNNTDKELRLSNFELILLFLVLLFSIEWIIRKLLRMI